MRSSADWLDANSFARIGAALRTRVENIFVKNRRLRVRLHEKGGKRPEVLCHHHLEDYLVVCPNICALHEDKKVRCTAEFPAGLSN